MYKNKKTDIHSYTYIYIFFFVIFINISHKFLVFAGTYSKSLYGITTINDVSLYRERH